MERSLTPLLAVAGRGVAGAAGVVIALPAQVGQAAERALQRLEEIAVGVHAMHGEMVGMREDLRRVDDGVAGLREEIVALREGVARVEANTDGLDPRLETLGTNLQAVDLLAQRLGRFGRRAPAA